MKNLFLAVIAGTFLFTVVGCADQPTTTTTTTTNDQSSWNHTNDK